MTITRGNKGATFIYNSKLYNFKLESSTEVVDSTGAGDAFVSCIIKNYLKGNLDFEKWYSDSVKLTSKVVTKMGARGHLNSLFKVKSFENSCLCDTFLYKERKKIKRCNININNLETRIINAIPAYKRLDEIGFCENDNYLFIGTGGSYANAVFSSKIINDLYGANTYSLYPRDVIYRNNKKINKIILFSYSGTTNDILNSIKDLADNDIYLITKGEPSKISAITNISKDNIISYRTSTNKGKEKGFLSFEGATSPASIFLKYYYSKIDKDFNVENFIRKSFNYWKNNIDKLVSNKFVMSLAKIKQVNIFSGDYTSSACYDLESKFIESGVTNCIIHEKKNFSHGRFINYENLNNSLSIYFKQKETDKYETELLNYLDKDNTIIIESNYNLMLAEFDLLIASQYIIYYIGKVLDIDVSKPNYSEKALKLYFYKGKL